MDLGGVSAFVGVCVAAVATIWTVYDGRAPLRRLERISNILKEVPAGSEAHNYLVFMQTDLARRINQNYRAPRKEVDAMMAWLLRVCGGLLSVSAYLALSTSIGAAVLPSVDGESQTYSVGSWVLFGMLGVLMLSLAAVALKRRRKERLLWISTHKADESHVTRL
jgi:hypothetical protein